MKKKNNKEIGTEFEQDICEYLYSQGYWATFLYPAPDGSQPFDVLGIKSNIAVAFDCKTLDGTSFPLDRVEDNQESAFTLMNKRGNNYTAFIIKISEKEIIIVPSQHLIEAKQKGIKSIKVETLKEKYGTIHFK